MAVIEQKLSKVAHSLYADSDGDATNNCIRDHFYMSRVTEGNLPSCPPASVLLVGGGAFCWGCPPEKQPSPEVVLHFPVLPPGTHGFAGGGLPSAADCSSHGGNMTQKNDRREFDRFLHIIDFTRMRDAVLRRSDPRRS
ncbi:hypothetical protein SDC9_79276 [bioreactor metagenome]|uniref:Uncharacterized protein n=1 Tax=bioreactor metagenome TaxID=1076179 RepID=A0A644YXZ9_9ZZZZ